MSLMSNNNNIFTYDSGAVAVQWHRMAYNDLIWFPNPNDQVPNPNDHIRFLNPLAFEVRQGTFLKSDHIYS